MSEALFTILRYFHALCSIVLLAAVFRFMFHVFRGNLREFLRRSRTTQFFMRWWKPMAAGYLLLALLLEELEWTHVYLLIFLLILTGIYIVLRLWLERLEQEDDSDDDEAPPSQ